MLIILEAHRTTVCPIWTTARTRQIVERVGLSGRQGRGPIELWDSGADQFGDMRQLGGQRGAATILKEQAGALGLGSKASARSSMAVCLPGHLAFQGRPLRASICAAHRKEGRLTALIAARAIKQTSKAYSTKS
jgi:hypothetical protein